MDKVSLINIPDRLYIKRRGKELAFMIPYADESSPKKDQASFKKRKETCDRWGDSRDEMILDNKATTGFKITVPVVRYTTSNVVWRVLDPRGFELEIYTANMKEIIEECNIVKGEIMHPAFWSIDNGKAYLCVEGTKSHNQFKDLQKDDKTTDYKIGDIIEAKVDKKIKTVRYLGKFWYIESRSEKITPATISGRDYNRSRSKVTFVNDCAYIYDCDGRFLSRKSLIVGRIVGHTDVPDDYVEKNAIKNGLYTLKFLRKEKINDNDFQLIVKECPDTTHGDRCHFIAQSGMNMALYYFGYGPYSGTLPEKKKTILDIVTENNPGWEIHDIGTKSYTVYDHDYYRRDSSRMNWNKYGSKYSLLVLNVLGKEILV